MWFNPIMATLLRSPLHALISKNTLLITYQGRKSGKEYTTPVNYVQDGGDLLVTSFRNRTWWRNLQGGAPVTVRIRGRQVKGAGEAITKVEDVSAYMLKYLRKAPQVAKYYQVGLDSNGLPKPEDVAQSAKERVIVRVQLGE